MIQAALDSIFFTKEIYFSKRLFAQIFTIQKYVFNLDLTQKGTSFQRKLLIGQLCRELGLTVSDPGSPL